MRLIKAEFGYYPAPIDFTSGDLTVATLPGLDAAVSVVESSPTRDGKWIYPGLMMTSGLDGRMQALPYSHRIFQMPQTHVISGDETLGPDRLEFLVWAMSFFTGMRLTTTEAGFVDATPVRPGVLVDFTLTGPLAGGLALADEFWRANLGEPLRAKRWAAAVHALFLAAGPQNLQFEKFTYLYAALDACYRLTLDLTPGAKSVFHSERMAWMCDRFGMPTPKWAAKQATGSVEVAKIRNAVVHEALFMGQPLGFALHGVGTSTNLTLEMEALVCRLLVALLGAPTTDFVRSPVNTRQIHGLTL